MQKIVVTLRKGHCLIFTFRQRLFNVDWLVPRASAACLSGKWNCWAMTSNVRSSSSLVPKFILFGFWKPKLLTRILQMCFLLSVSVCKKLAFIDYRASLGIILVDFWQSRSKKIWMVSRLKRCIGLRLCVRRGIRSDTRSAYCHLLDWMTDPNQRFWFVTWWCPRGLSTIIFRLRNN